MDRYKIINHHFLYFFFDILLKNPIDFDEKQQLP